MKKILMIFLLLVAGFAYADNDIHSGEDVSGKSFLGESHKNSVWDGVTAIGTQFSKYTGSGYTTYISDYSNSSFRNANLTNASFSGAILKDVDTTGAIIKGASFEDAEINDMSILTKTKSYMGKDLSGVNLQTNILKTNVKIVIYDFSGFNLTGAALCANLYNPDNPYYTDPNGIFKYDDAIILGAKMEKICFLKEQFCSTKSYKDKMLDGISVSETNFSGIDLNGASLKNAKFGYINLSDSDFSNTNLTGAVFVCLDLMASRYADVYSLKNAVFFNANLTNVRFNEVILQNVDFRGANMTNTYITETTFSGITYRDVSSYKNTIMTDGEIKNFSMSSAEDNFSIRKYIPAATDGAMINAKIVEDATISGGAVLTLEEGAVLEISAGKTLTVSDNGEIVFDVDAATDDTNIILNSGSKLVFGDNSKLTINLSGEVSETDPLHFTVIKAADDSYVLGLDTLPKDNIILNVNGTAYDSNKWGINFDPTTGNLDISVNVPEPATYAAIFGALALGFAVYRRRK